MIITVLEHWYILCIWAAVLSIVGFAMMGIDKFKAKKDLWRVPEKNFFIVAVLGGAIGTILGMKVFRHKTLHKHFQYGLPAILIVHVVGIAALVVWLGINF